MYNQGSINVTVVLHIGIGSFEQGFPVRAEIFENGLLFDEKKDFTFLPPASDIPKFYREWQALYSEMGQTRKLPNPSRTISIPPQTTNHSSTKECQSAAKKLENYLQAKPAGWFNHSSFQHLRDWIRAHQKVKQDQSIPVFFDFETGQEEQNAILKRLPWHLWDLFTKLQNAEVAIRGIASRPVQPLSQPVKILAIFGSGEGGLQLEEDIKTLEGLKPFGADVQSEREPTRKRLHNRLDKKPWDILFFSGHSLSDENLKSGYLLISKGKSYSLNSDLKVDLQTAVNNGLKMAIFNSCDGLGIADFLMNLKLPIVIVFREPVPDLVAREFLKNFLEEFSSGKPLYQSVRVARRRLHWLESAEQPYPCASWLPVICQNPSQPELVWPQVDVWPTPPTVVQHSQNPSQNQGVTDSDTGISAPPPITPHKPWKRYGLVAAIGLALLGTIVWLIQPKWGSSLKAYYSSLGETILIDGDTIAGGDENKQKCKNTEEKQAGTEAFANEKFSNAMNHFDRFLESCPFDPETQIYYNNAKALDETNSTAFSGHKETIRIAVSVPIGSEGGFAKGDKADVAQEMLRGVAIAQDNINKNGGIQGKPLLIEIVDDDKPGTLALSDRIQVVGSELAADPAIFAVIGPYDSKATQLLGDAIGQKNLTIISPTSTAVRQSSNDSGSLPLSPNILRTATTDALAAQKLADDISQAGKSKVTVIYDENNPYSKSLKEEFEKATQKSTDVIPCNLANGNTTPDGCFNNENPDSLLWIPPPEVPHEAISFIKSNNDRLPVWAGDSAYGGHILRQLGSTAHEMKIFVPWAVEADSNLEALEAFNRNWLEMGINWRTAMAYDATQAIAEGLRRMGDAPKRERLREQLLSQDFQANGILGAGTVQFTREGEANDGVEVGDRKPSENLGVMVEVKCEPAGSATCSYENLLID